MQTEKTAFHSDGLKLAATIHKPDGAGDAPLPVLVDGVGWLGTQCSEISEIFHERLVAGGYAVLTFDNRGFGESEGERGWIRPFDQIYDLLNAIVFARTRGDLDDSRLGLFGFGGTGGGNAIIAAALEPRVKAVVIQSGVADGPDWMHRMRREYEWVAFKERVDRNRLARVLGEPGELVDPREELMVATPERKQKATFRHSDDQKVGGDFHLATAEFLLQYRPLDYVHRIAPRAFLITSVEDDVVSPEDHAQALFEKAGAPKKLISQTGVTHYEAYLKNLDVTMPQFLEWYDRHLGPHSLITARTAEPIIEVIRL